MSRGRRSLLGGVGEGMGVQKRTCTVAATIARNGNSNPNAKQSQEEERNPSCCSITTYSACQSSKFLSAKQKKQSPPPPEEKTCPRDQIQNRRGSEHSAATKLFRVCFSLSCQVELQRSRNGKKPNPDQNSAYDKTGSKK
jgi:hypothetical protein